MGVTYLACLIAGLLAQTPAFDAKADAPTPAMTATSLPAPLALFRPLEVRLRKLHLVRPDLLQYAIPYDTFC